MAAVGCGVRLQGSASCLKPVPSGEAKPLGSLRLTPSALTFPSFRQLTTDNGPRTTDNQLHAPCSLPYALLAFNQPHQSNQFNQLNQPNQSNQSVLGPMLHALCSMPFSPPPSNLRRGEASRLLTPHALRLSSDTSTVSLGAQNGGIHELRSTLPQPRHGWSCRF
jgi:hypothetical protein